MMARLNKVFRSWCCVVVLFGALVLKVNGRISDPASGNHQSTGCPAEFQGKCHCGTVPYGPGHKPTYVTNCTNAGFDDSDMLRHLPIETEVLIFIGNEVYDLHFNIFGLEANYDNLHTVDLSDNHIQTIKGRTFHNVNSVRKLILNDNDLYLLGKDHHPRMFSNFLSLEELHLKNAFADKVMVDKTGQYMNNLAATFRESKMNKLTVLDLSENGISVIDDKRLFCALPNLKKLYLNNNRLVDFDQELLCLSHLDVLDLSHNYFSYFSNSTLTKISEVTGTGLTLNFSGNPFRCDCHMIETYHFLLNAVTQLVDKDSYECVNGFPMRNVGESLLSLHSRDLVCPIESDSFNGHLHASYVVLTLILFIFAILIGVFVFRNRAEVKSLASRIVSPLRNKLNYSSLDKRDVEAEMEV